MKTFLTITQIIIAIALVALVMLQGPSDSSSNRLSLVKPQFSRRGVEKVTFIVTLMLLFLFLISSFIQLII